MVFNLVDISILTVMKNCSYEIISNLLLVQFPNSAIDLILSLYPINYVIMNEKNVKFCSNTKKVWKFIIEKLSSRNHILKAKLKAAIDGFELWKFLKRDDEQLFNHQRQVLINALFLEVLEKADFDEKNMSCDFISLPLHDSLKGNSPNVSDMEWLLMLSHEINSFNFYQNKANFLLANKTICHSIAKHSAFINLKLITCLNDCEETQATFLKVYRILYTMLSQNCIKKVSFDHLNNTNGAIKLLQLCCGQCDEKYLRMLEMNKQKTTDIWDDALGEDFRVASEVENLDATDNIYDDFSNVNELNLSLTYESTHLSGLNFESILELEFEIKTFNVTDFISMLDVSNFMKIKKLGLGFEKHAPIVYAHNCTAQAISFLQKLLSNPNSKLSVLKLSNFSFAPYILRSLSGALKQNVEIRSCLFEELAFVDCALSENMTAIDDLDLSIHSYSYLDTFYVKSIKFCEYSSFETFLYCLKPLKVCIVGNCTCDGNEYNLALLKKAFHYSPTLKNKSQSFIVELPMKMDKRGIKKFCDALSYVNFTSLLVVHHGFVPPMMHDHLKLYADNVVFVRSNISAIHCSLTKEEFLSQM